MFYEQMVEELSLLTANSEEPNSENSQPMMIPDGDSNLDRPLAVLNEDSDNQGE